MRTSTIRALVKKVLENPEGFEWSLQGLGMLRLYLSDDKSIRLHVWSGEHVVEDVSTLHTHPWNFTSLVVSGQLLNRRWYNVMTPDALAHPTHMCQSILCGEGGGLVGEPTPVHLVPDPLELYVPGSTYQQHAHEIHDSMPEDGTVTVIKRSFLNDVDHANVYWPAGEEWVSAEPRRATPTERNSICDRALARWES